MPDFERMYGDGGDSHSLFVTAQTPRKTPTAQHALHLNLHRKLMHSMQIQKHCS